MKTRRVARISKFLAEASPVRDGLRVSPVSLQAGGLLRRHRLRPADLAIDGTLPELHASSGNG